MYNMILTLIKKLGDGILDKRKVVGIVLAAVIITNLITFSILNYGGKTLDFLGSLYIDTNGVTFSNVEKYNNVKKILKTKFVDNLDDNALMEGAIRGLAEAVNDPYTEYLDKKEFDSLQVYTKSNYAGIGVVVGVDPKDNLILVSEVIENSPAERVKITAGDKIIKVNDTEVTGSDLDKAVSMIKGEKDTKVKITVIRDDKETLDFDVTRDIIDIKTIKSKMLGNNIGYIRIIQFSENTSEEFKTALNSLRTEGANKLVIDVRDNPGGLLDQVVEIGGQILPKGIVVYTIDRSGKREDYFSKGTELDIPYVVLVNERSASASEILAGAVKDYKKGTIIGTKTYGKGVVQSVFELGDGSGLKVTTSKYYTPNGISINKIGVSPDIEVKMENDKAIGKLTIEEDVQLKKAIDELSK